MVFLSLTPNYTTACETDDLARHTTTILLHFAIHKKYKLLHEFDGHFLTVLCESLTTIPPLNQKKECGADVKFQLGKDRNGISPLTPRPFTLVVFQS